MSHKIPEDVKNSDLEYCIDEYVRKLEHRDMLRERWFHGLTIEEIAEKHNVSTTVAKEIIWGVGDKILARANKRAP